MGAELSVEPRVGFERINGADHHCLVCCVIFRAALSLVTALAGCPLPIPWCQ